MSELCKAWGIFLKDILGVGKRLTAIFLIREADKLSDLIDLTDLTDLIDSLIFELRVSFCAIFFDTGDKIGFLLRIYSCFF